MTTAALQTVLTVPDRFRGPARSANGGWLAGTLAGVLNGGRSAVEVTLRAPTPLGTELKLEHLANSVSLYDGGKPLVEAIPVAEDVQAPPFVSFTEAARAEAGFAGRRAHAFPECFACGFREPGDGLRIFPGPVEGSDDLVAAGWRVPFTVADEDGVPPAVVGAALDCVTGWAHFRPGESALLGRLAVQFHRKVTAGGVYSVVARETGREGRKMFGQSAIYEVDGTLVAAAKATWIAPR
ncbi:MULTISPECIES: PaaI family thioesterase [Nonomuraea]|uniref:Thioesterase superfamily protein n=1 Tax=Nonomuraea ferruginea TaxID=46174 RepID=A0ABT4T627_9ACTN|nr:hypothetical protein [Nonomuraea ferruginea]MDA0644968.1 hypothetical protein [Nonomuraea ferruginea]